MDHEESTSINRGLARVSTQLELLVERYDRDTLSREKQQDAQGQHLDEMRREMVAVQYAIADVEHRVAEIEPVVQMVSSWRARTIGAGVILGMIGSSVIIFVTFFRDKLFAAFGA